MNKNENISLNIPLEMYDTKLVKKLVSLLRFRELTNNVNVTEEQIFEFTEEIQENWWKENKDWFLKDLKL